MKDGGDCMTRTYPVTRSRATQDVHVEQLCLIDLCLGNPVSALGLEVDEARPYSLRLAACR